MIIQKTVVLKSQELFALIKKHLEEQFPGEVVCNLVVQKDNRVLVALQDKEVK